LNHNFPLPWQNMQANRQCSRASCVGALLILIAAAFLVAPTAVPDLDTPDAAFPNATALMALVAPCAGGWQVPESTDHYAIVCSITGRPGVSCCKFVLCSGRGHRDRSWWIDVLFMVLFGLLGAALP